MSLTLTEIAHFEEVCAQATRAIEDEAASCGLHVRDVLAILLPHIIDQHARHFGVMTTRKDAGEALQAIENVLANAYRPAGNA